MKSNKRLLVRCKRVLAWLLAVTMVTGTLPTSVVHAAEIPAAETVDVVSAGDVSVSDVTANDVTAQVAAAGDSVEAAVEEVTKELYAEGDTATTTTTSNKAVVTWDADKLASKVKDAGFTYDYVAKQAETAYKAKSEGAYTTLENRVNEAVKVEAGGKEVSATPTYEWKQNGAAVATGKPSAVGTYQLVATVNASEGILASDPTTVLTLEIKKAPIEIALTNNGNNDNGSNNDGRYDWTFRAGITVAEVKTYVSQNLIFKVNGATVAQGDIATSVNLSVIEAYTGIAPEGGDNAVLQKNQDYCVDVTLTLKESASYEVAEKRFNIRLRPQTRTKIEVTYADANNARAKGKVYDGAELVYTTDDGGLNSTAAGFSAKVLYDKDGNWDNGCEAELANAKITGRWLDADKEPLAGNPVHAGVYYYELTYYDENGTYAYADEEIRVEIEPAKIMLVPELPADYKVYGDMHVSDILKQVDYKVYNVAENGGRGTEKTDIDKKRFWGVYDRYVEALGNESDYNQYYEPLFEVQRGTTENGVVTWKHYDGDIVWQETETREVVNETTNETTTITVTINYSYRIVFTGEKGVYGVRDSENYKNHTIGTGTETLYNDRKDINESQGDYTVSTSLAVREAAENVYNISPSTATKVTINVEPICENGAGKTYDNPIERTYVGTYEGIYATRDEYKKAEVANGNGVLNYAWYQLDAESIALDKDGHIKYDKLDWDFDWYKDNDSWYNGVDDYCSPYLAGVYRLEVSYEDSTYATYADPVYVYYVIHPQSAKVEITGSPEIYADGLNTAGALLRSLQNVNPDDKATYVALKGYRVNATGKNTVTPVELKEGEVDPVQTRVERWFNDVDDRLDYFCVEKLQKTEENPNGTWVEVGTSYVLSNDETYRISFNRDYYNYCDTSYDSDYLKDEKPVYYTICRNTVYNFGLQLDKCNQVLDEEYYENVSANATAKKSEAAVITIDTSAFVGFEKVYDGKPLELEALKNSIKVTTTVNGEVTDVTSEVGPLLKYVIHDRSVWDDDADEYFVVDLINAVHAGKYDVDIVFEANEKYRQEKKTVYGKLEIKQKEIPVKFELKEAVKAGVRLGSISYNTDQIFADEILKSDNVENVCTFDLVDPVVVPAVMDGETELRAAVDESDVTKIVGKPHYWWINESTSKNNNSNYTGYLKSSKTYYVKVTRFEYGTYVDSVYRKFGKMSYDRDYVAVSEEKSFTPVRAAAKVEAVDTALNDKVTESEGVFQHTINAREDVLFDYTRNGNIFRFKLNAPGEFFGEKSFAKGSYVYENVIKNVENAGGSVESAYDNYIIVAFNLALNKTVEFDVIFDINLDEKNEIYTEKYVIDLSKMVPEADMEKAVAPKSLAFNGAPKKLAVGEEVQLDVNVKKNQMSDIVLLGYESDNTDVLQVSATGYVTAIAKGSANITVYPCKRAGGKLVKLDEEKKSVAKKIKITVTDVAKPKLSKVTGRDEIAFITYTIPANGYRRELYVMEGKKKEKDFEDAIAAVVNGDYSAFTFVNLDLSDKEKNSYYKDNKNVVSNVEIYGLTPEFKDGYTVYLRNVSGLYTMADGTEVATSAAGAVKNFKTTKSEAQDLVVYLTDPKVVVANTRDKNNRYDYFKVNFADKASKVTVDAMFWEQYSKGYSDDADYIWRTLPLGAEKGSYNIPKMKFFVSNQRVLHDDREEKLDTSSMTKVDDHKWVYKTALAKIDNGGKITYLGKGIVYVLAYDMVSKTNDWLTLEIDANPDSMSAKAIKLQPGQSIYLSDYLEYKEGKAKVINYPYYCDLVTKTESNEYFKIDYVEDAYNPDDEHGGDYYITALKAGGTINIDVEDRVVTANGGRGTTLKITSPAVEAVKSAKTSAAYDDKFRVTFAYPTPSMNFRFELKNASGKVITDTIQTCTGKWDAKAKKYIYTVNFGDPSDWAERSYDEDGNPYYKWAEWHTPGNNDVSAVVNRRNRITLLSNYTVGITAVYSSKYTNVDKAEMEKTQMSKTVNVKVKTTNVPASYWDVDAYNIARSFSVKEDGGATIDVFVNTNEESTDIKDVLLKAGNTYDLQFNPYEERENLAAQKRMSDSLTWKSSNSKVASIKANPGTFTAKLVAVKQGTTTIEVTSKLTKKVIARWTVKIGAVGDAKNYFGENTPYKNGDEIANLPWESYLDLQKNATKLTLNNRRTVSLQAGQTKCFVFEVPAYGMYNAYGGDYYESGLEDGDNWYEKGEKLYIWVTNRGLSPATRTVYVTGDAYTEIKLGDNTVLNGGNYVFRAPLDNWYTFTYVNPEDANDINQVGAGPLKANATYTCDSSDRLYSVEPGKEVTLRVTAREVKGSLTIAEAGNPITLNNKQTVWYQFDATEANLYTFTYEAKDGKQVSVNYANSLMDYPTYMYNNWDNPMDANSKLYVSVSSTDATAEAPVEVTIKITKRDMAGTAPAAGAETDVEFTKAEAKYYEFTAPADGFYRFTATGSKNENLEVEVYESLTAQSGSGSESGAPVSVVYYLNTNNKIYLRVKPTATIAENEKVSVKLKTENTVPQMLGTNSTSFKLSDTGSLTVYFKMPEQGYYNYEVTGQGESTSVSGSVSVDAGWPGSTYFYISDPLTGRIVLNGTPDADVTVTITKD